jgi:mono/diheme cytochrome c family protein
MSSRYHRASPGFGSRWLVCLIAAIVLSHAADVLAQTARTGRQVYESACAACHGSDGRGSPSVADSLACMVTGIAFVDRVR